VYMNARYYLPGTGRFASADVIVPDGKDPQAHNRYSYVRNNSLVYIDPSGHCWGFASGLRDGYFGTTCNNIETAWSIVTNPNTSPQERLLPATYLGTGGVAVATVVVGTTVVFCGKIPNCLEVATAMAGLPPPKDEGLVRDFDNNETESPFGTPRNLPDPSASDDEIQEALGENWNPPVNPKANWHNGDTGESLRPDRHHEPPIGPHWDYTYRGNPNPDGWRIYPDGRVEPKWH
jgi:hypothetical protein